MCRVTSKKVKNIYMFDFFLNFPTGKTNNFPALLFQNERKNENLLVPLL